MLVIPKTIIAFKLLVAKTGSTLSRESLSLACVGTYFWRQRENLERLAVMCSSLSEFLCASYGFHFVPKVKHLFS